MWIWAQAILVLTKRVSSFIYKIAILLLHKFYSTGAYSFSNNYTKLTINNNSFTYIEGYSYQFLVQGSTEYGAYDQLVTVNVQNFNSIPIVNLGYLNKF